MKERERFASRLGFILISAGCAIGLGDVWRFPYIAGQYGGGIFVLIYLVFIFLIGIPIMTMELAVGRASQRSIATSFKVLQKKGQKWYWMGYAGAAGNYILMMFYTTIAGWMLAYFYKMMTGQFVGLDTQQVSQVFADLVANPIEMTIWMVITTVVCFGICSLGLQEGVERVTKIMMVLLLAIIVLPMPCILGFNVLKWIQPMGAGSSILDLEDFIISYNLLPMGSLVYLLFCVSRYGWGFENYIEEVNAGEGLKMPRALRGYLSWILPIIVLIVLIQGYINVFGN